VGSCICRCLRGLFLKSCQDDRPDFHTLDTRIRGVLEMGFEVVYDNRATVVPIALQTRTGAFSDWMHRNVIWHSRNENG